MADGTLGPRVTAAMRHPHPADNEILHAIVDMMDRGVDVFTAVSRVMTVMERRAHRQGWTPRATQDIGSRVAELGAALVADAAAEAAQAAGAPPAEQEAAPFDCGGLMLVDRVTGVGRCRPCEYRGDAEGHERAWKSRTGR